ncbi:MAG TPA: hypothetical protein VL171_09755 [Verrucomicrobiae bacterium]|nr:hypothetical protein [Verrucomicrobiae bacterium]
MAIGDRYLGAWKESCEANWREYAEEHNYDLICIDQPLDTSERACKRSPSWQKCLIPSHQAVKNYEQVVWIDSDVLINTATAPCIFAAVPADKVGAVNQWATPSATEYAQILQRLQEFWGERAIRNDTAKQYYANYGLPAEFDEVVQCGVLVFSPQHHRDLFQMTYCTHEEKGGPEWNYEMRPLSYELLRAKAVHWIDPRFNVTLFDQICLHYPFLINEQPQLPMTTRIRRKLAADLGGLRHSDVRRTCLNAVMANSFFLHFGGGSLVDMNLIDLRAHSWRHCILQRQS